MYFGMFTVCPHPTGMTFLLITLAKSSNQVGKDHVIGTDLLQIHIQWQHLPRLSQLLHHMIRYEYRKIVE